MKVVKVKYTEIWDEPVYEWIKVKTLYVLKSTFVVFFEAEVYEGETPTYMELRLEYPKSVLQKFKKKYGLN